MKGNRFEFGFDVDLDAVPESKPKPDPGNSFKSHVAVTTIDIEWDKNVKDVIDCDVPHLLYLLQIGCDLHRQWANKRNQYFASISRTDRFIDHIDGP